MWKPVNLELFNFLSHIYTSYEYSSGLECIQGINLDIDIEDDSGEKESNGSGKSVLLEGEYFALLDTPLREDIRIDDLIFDKDLDIKGAEVIFILYNPLLDLKLKIHRKIWFKKSSELYLYTCKLNEEFPEKPNEEFSSVGEGDKRVIELLGIQKEDIINYYIISKKKYKSFHRSSDDKKKEIVARFSGSYLIEGIDKEIELDLEEEKKKLKLEDDKILKLDAQIEVYQNEIENLNTEIENIKATDFEKEKNEKIEGVNKTIEINKNKILLVEEKLKKINENIELKEIALEKEKKKKVSDSDLEKFEKQLKEVEIEKGDIDKKEIEIDKQLADLKVDLKEWEILLDETEKGILGSIKCPKCTHEWNLKDGNLSIKELKEKMPDIELGIEEIKNDIETRNKLKEKNKSKLDSLKIDKHNIQLKIDSIDKQKRELYLSILSIENEIKTIREDKKSNEDNIKIYEKHIGILEKEIKEIKEKQIEDKTEEINLKIKEQEKEIQIREDSKLEIDKNKKKIDETIADKSQWIYLFNAFRSHLANKAIKNIEGQANLFLQEMKSDLQIQLEGFTLLADKKTIREKISCEIIRNGLSAGMLGKCSEGEKARIELATILALQKLLNISSTNGGLDLLSIDEILESVSSTGMNKVVESLLNINSCVQLITHVNLNKNHSNISRFVIKENGISVLQPK